MAEQKRKYDSTVARIAGNLLSGRKPCVDGIVRDGVISCRDIDAAEWAVALAREIVAQVERTEPK